MVSPMFTRRYGAYIVCAIIVILTFTHYREPIVSRVRFHYTSTSFSGTSPITAQFYWDNVTFNYPFEDLLPLPSTKSGKLPRVQFKFPAETAEQAKVRKERQAAVKLAFQRCWQSYSQLAWLHDEVDPISGGFKDSFGGWAATLVDSLDTLWIMDMKDEFQRAADAALTIDLATSTLENINVFETTIRHLGGFLSAYDLSHDPRLLTKAHDFGTMLLHAFDTPNHLPITRWSPQLSLTTPQTADPTVLLAELGSLSLEFTRLSQLTSDPRFYTAIDRITRLLASQQSETHLPGLWPITVDAQHADLTRDTSFTLGAMADSTYEYLPKMVALLGGKEPVYEEMWKRAAGAAEKYTLFVPMTPGKEDVLMAGIVRRDGPDAALRLVPEGQHLVCFAGGMFALGGRLVGREEWVDTGRRLTDGCIWAYKAGPMGIMPEVFTVVPCTGAKGEVCEWEEEKWRDEVMRMVQEGGRAEAEQVIRRERLPRGFSSIGDRRYILRPEAIESVFILYRLTGDRGLLETAWEMFSAIIMNTETPLANAALADVTYSAEELEKTGRTVQMDSMESFWMAETLKYFYLIFSEPDVISLDEWVFNTEAHPLKRPS